MGYVAEKDLVIGDEYFLDSTKTDRGFFIKNKKGLIYFKPTHGKDYDVNTSGLIVFSACDYTYESV